MAIEETGYTGTIRTGYIFLSFSSSLLRDFTGSVMLIALLIIITILIIITPGGKPHKAGRLTLSPDQFLWDRSQVGRPEMKESNLKPSKLAGINNTLNIMYFFNLTRIVIHEILFLIKIDFNLLLILSINS
jgi:hypothetical protein